MQNRSVQLKVVGTYYYSGTDLFRQGLLKRGARIDLTPEPHNPHDRNAVAVILNSKIIGHLSREAASKYQSLLLRGHLLKANVASCALNSNGSALDLKLRVIYETEGSTQNRFTACDSVSDVPGVYEIRLASQPTYVGSSFDLRKRCKIHLRDLRKNRHDNFELQSLFNRYREERFEFHVVSYSKNSNAALEEESEHIKFALSKGAKLLNKTIDGKGYRSGTGFGDPIYMAGELSQKHKPKSPQSPEPTHQRESAVNTNKQMIHEPNPKSWGIWLIVILLVFGALLF